MLDRIEEIRKSLDAGLYQAALSLALTLPDICGQVEFPSDSSNVRVHYVDWLKRYLPSDVLADDCFAGYFKTLSYDNIYKLRCSFLHSGNNDIEEATIDKFYITRPEGIGKDSNGKAVGYRYRKKQDGDKEIHTATIDVRYLCESLCNTAEEYYNMKDKSDFESHTVVFDVDTAREGQEDR